MQLGIIRTMTEYNSENEKFNQFEIENQPNAEWLQ